MLLDELVDDVVVSCFKSDLVPPVINTRQHVLLKLSVQIDGLVKSISSWYDQS